VKYHFKLTKNISIFFKFIVVFFLHAVKWIYHLCQVHLLSIRYIFFDDLFIVLWLFILTNKHISLK